MFCEKGVLRNFAKFTWKHLCHSLFFNKVAGLRKWQTSCEFCEISRNTFFYRTPLVAASIIPITPGVRKKGYKYLNKPADESCRFFKYVWVFNGKHALKGYNWQMGIYTSKLLLFWLVCSLILTYMCIWYTSWLS